MAHGLTITTGKQQAPLTTISASSSTLRVREGKKDLSQCKNILSAQYEKMLLLLLRMMMFLQSPEDGPTTAVA